MSARMRETVLVTGGAGYVGSHAVADLVAHGYAVVVFDNMQQGHQAAVADGADLVVGDLSDRDAVRRLFAGRRFDAVMHFAANSLVGESMRQPFRYLGDNVANAVNLIEACVSHGVGKFVFSSTCAIFGRPERVPIDEEWFGYEWNEMVRGRGLASPWKRHRADAGVDNQLAFLEEALDWVAENTPRDTETAYIEAIVTTWRNLGDPETTTLRSVDRQ